MAGLTNQNVRDYTRLYLDVDSTDIPDSLVDMWVREAQVVLLKSRPYWPHLVGTSTITTSDGTSDYLTTLERIRDIQGPEYVLREIDITEGDRKFTPNITDAAEPRYWARVDRSNITAAWTIRLYPEPTGVLEYTARGVNVAEDPAASATSRWDVPDEFHPLMTQFVIAKACFQQNDYEQGGIIMQQFEASIAIMRHNLDSEAPEPLVLNGRRNGVGLVDPRFEFEPRSF